MLMSGSGSKSLDIRLQKPVVLVGMMGVGKTYIGRQLSKGLGVSFVDSDDEIVNSAGQSIPDIFEFYGEAAFRDLEKKVIQRLVENKASVISTGGGCVTQSDTLERLKSDTYLIWLNSDIDTLVERTSKRDDRPLLQGKDHKETLEKLLKERKPLYAQAHLEVNADGDSKDTLNTIFAYLDSQY